jgi:hypothetical protein
MQVAHALQGEMNGATSSTNSTILESQSLVISGFPAQEYVMALSTVLSLFSQYVLANQRMFLLSMVRKFL